MRKLNLLSLLLIALSIVSCNTKKDNSQPPEQLSIIPLPADMNIVSGNFTINGTTGIDVKDEELKEVGNYLSEYVKTMFGIELKEGAGITIEKSDSLADEEYLLCVKKEKIVIKAKTGRGAFYGVQSLMQLMPSQKKQLSEIKIQAVKISDKPRYKWRGMHLDVGRHFFSVDFIKKMIDMMAMYKMNTFHWHLTEDQGWRIEIKKYPKLTEMGAWRNGTLIGHQGAPPHKTDDKKYGGFYTQEQIKEVVAYAKSKYIDVVPEIELPGHAVAALAAYPEFSCTGGPFEVRKIWGVSEDVYCAGKDETFEFLENILSEVVELFPYKYFHIGGDECPKNRWKECPACQKRIKDEGLADEHELQSYFIKRIEKFLHSKNKKLIGWDEILEGGLPERAVVMSWRGISGGITAAKQGHDVIMSPNGTLYFDHYQDIENEPLAIGGLTDLEEVYGVNPTPDELNEKEAKHIIGAQANVWTEYIPTPEHAEYMIYPRLCAIAEVVWTPLEKKNWEDFSFRMKENYNRLMTKGVNFRVPNPTGIMKLNKFVEDTTSVKLNNPVSCGKIHYTLDGSEPTKNSPVYEKPIKLTLDKEKTLKYRLILPDGKQSTVKTGIFSKTIMLEANDAPTNGSGLKFEYFEGEFKTVEEIKGEAKVEGTVDKIVIPKEAREDNFACIISGYISISEEGVYNFYTTSDDGSALYIDDKKVVDNDGAHGRIEKYGSVGLKKGMHKIAVKYFEVGGANFLNAKYESAKIKKQEIPADILFY